MPQDSRKADLSAEIRQTENTLKNKGLHGVVERLNSTLSVLKVEHLTIIVDVFLKEAILLCFCSYFS